MAGLDISPKEFAALPEEVRRKSTELWALDRLYRLADVAGDERARVMACEALLRYAADGYAGAALDATADGDVA